MALFDSKKELVDSADKLGEELAEKVKSHQLRRIFETVQRIYERTEPKGDLDMELKGELQLLKPQLAYTVSRKPELKSLQTKLTELVNKIEQSSKASDVKELYQFVQSILAYHKYHGGD